MPGTKNFDANYDKISLTIKDTRLYVPVINLSAKDNQKLSKRLNKEFEKCIKQKVVIELRQTSINIFSNQTTLYELTDCLFWFN